MILCLETATTLCSVALCDNNGIVALKESREGKSHASLLTVFIGEVMEEAGISARELEAIAVSKGPGSYTGLRIGVSVAKGIAYASTIPLIGIDTTLAMYNGFCSYAKENISFVASDLFCPMLDARRMEVYDTIFDASGKIYRELKAEVIDENSFSGIPSSSRIFFFGDGAEKCRNIVRHKNASFFYDFNMSAAHLCSPSFEALSKQHFEDVAYFEPFYLKDFITSKPVKNVLGK